MNTSLKRVIITCLGWNCSIRFKEIWFTVFYFVKDFISNPVAYPWAESSLWAEEKKAEELGAEDKEQEADEQATEDDEQAAEEDASERAQRRWTIQAKKIKAKLNSFVEDFVIFCQKTMCHMWGIRNQNKRT